jgi:hypothetical protein
MQPDREGIASRGADYAEPCSGGLEKKAPEEQDAQDYQDSNDDDLYETHGRFLWGEN